MFERKGGDEGRGGWLRGVRKMSTRGSGEGGEAWLDDWGGCVAA